MAEIVSSNKLKDSKLTDKRLRPDINSSIKQNKFKDRVVKSECMDAIKRDQSITTSNKNETGEIILDELSQPKIKRRRVLSSTVHNSWSTKESDTKFPFSPIYKRTRSFHKKSLPISKLIVQQKNSSEKG